MNKLKRTVCCMSILLVAYTTKASNNTPPGLEKDRLKAEVIRLLAQEGNKQALLDFITQENLPEDVKILIPTHLENGQCEQAKILLQGVLNIEENKNFIRFYEVLASLCETGRKRNEMNATEQQIIREVSESADLVSVHAESLLAELGLKQINRVPEKTVQTQGMRIREDDTESEYLKQVDSWMLTVYPNPSEDGVITVKISNSETGYLQISDAMGRINLDQRYTKIDGYVTATLPQGMYIIKYISEAGVIESKSVFIK